MFAQFFGRPRWSRWAYGVGFAILTLWCFETWVQVRLNAWVRRFFDEIQLALEGGGGGLGAYHTLLRQWLLLQLASSVITPVTRYLARLYSLRWREALTVDYAERWCAQPGRLPRVDSASQRVQEDTQRFARGFDTVGHDVLLAVLELCAFVPVLHHLGGVALVAASVGGNLVCLLGNLVVGHRLVALDYANQRVEASLRKELVYFEDGVSGHGALGTLLQLWTVVRANYATLFGHLTYFELWARFSDGAMQGMPMFVMMPVLLRGQMALGTYMQAQRAFMNVQGRLGQISRRWPEINELRSVARRLHELERELARGPTPTVGRLDATPTEKSRLMTVASCS
tara:strand:+ start:76 stop:1101 length:1026 start_codon:yes stop_codon:yes gene_type:complete